MKEKDKEIGCVWLFKEGAKSISIIGVKIDHGENPGN
jgi:hypothetical protein